MHCEHKVDSVVSYSAFMGCALVGTSAAPHWVYADWTGRIVSSTGAGNFTHRQKKTVYLKNGDNSLHIIGATCRYVVCGFSAFGRGENQFCRKQ